MTPILYKQIGWMKCVACSDNKCLPGRMWLGVNERTGHDIQIECPECKGTQLVPKYKIVNALTGEEIDYENQGGKKRIIFA